MDSPWWFLFVSCFGIFITGVLGQSAYSGGSPAGYGSPGGYGSPAGYGTAPAPQGNAGYGPGGGYSGNGPAYAGGATGSYGYGGPKYPGQGNGIYFKKPIPIDEKPIFFRTPYWLPNMYYGHYGYPWTEYFDGGPRYVVPIMTAYPRGGGGTQSYQTGYGGPPGVGAGGYGGPMSPSGGYNQPSNYAGGSPAYSTTPGTVESTTADALNDGFSYYKGIPIYQTYYEKYLLDKAQATTAAPTR